MSYIFESTNTIRIICIDLADNDSVYGWVEFSGFADLKPQDENGEYLTVNNEILTNNLGMRMSIDVSIINRTGVNTQADIITLFEYINLVKGGQYAFWVYPSYDSTMQLSTLDKFVCVTDGYYNIEKLHKCLKAGQDIKVTFKEKSLHKSYIPKIPHLISNGEPVPYGVGITII